MQMDLFEVLESVLNEALSIVGSSMTPWMRYTERIQT